MNAEKITQFESSIGGQLPEDLREYLRTTPSKDEIWLQLHHSIDGREHTIRTIFGIEGGVPEDLDIEVAFGTSRRCLPKNAVPVAHSLGGYIFVYLDAEGRNGCYYLDHEHEVTQDNIYQVTTSFPEFINSLGPPEEDW